MKVGFRLIKIVHRSIFEEYMLFFKVKVYESSIF